MIGATKHLTKNELTNIIRSVIKELLREELLKFLTTEQFVLDTLRESVQDFTKTDQFRYLVEGVFERERTAIRGILEDAGLKVAIKCRKRGARPAGVSRKVKL